LIGHAHQIAGIEVRTWSEPIADKRTALVLGATRRACGSPPISRWPTLHLLLHGSVQLRVAHARAAPDQRLPCCPCRSGRCRSDGRSSTTRAALICATPTVSRSVPAPPRACDIVDLIQQPFAPFVILIDHGSMLRKQCAIPVARSALQSGLASI
jgi:hypothetical protein